MILLGRRTNYSYQPSVRYQLSTTVLRCRQAIVCLILVFVVVPLVFVTSSRSTMNLFIFGNVMERKTVEMRKEKRKTDRILNQMLPKAISYR